MRLIHHPPPVIAPPAPKRPRPLGSVSLPPPRSEGVLSVERCLSLRRSSRNYSGIPLKLEEIGQLLWAAQGVTGVGGLRACPSPRALYPLRLDVVAGAVEGLPAGIYRYDPDRHALLARLTGDRRKRISHAALDQQCAADAAAILAISASYSSLLREFGERGPRLAPIEAGHAGQNVCLQATALDLGAIGMGAFDEVLLRKALTLAGTEDPLYMVAVGHKL